jgi:hypothetical protein
MYLVKTIAGQQAFKERHADFSPRLRSAFLQFDGQRSLGQVLESMAGLGVTQDEVMGLVEREWLAPREATGIAVAAPAVAAAAVAAATAVAPAAAAVAPAAAAGAVDAPADVPSEAQRYRRAYPLAVAITAGMGLKGFRLNMAVEAAVGYEQLVALAPRLREAASAASYAPLHEALFGSPP